MPFIAFRAGGSGDVSESHAVWSTEYGPEVPTPTTDGERLYVIDDKGVALCLRIEDGTTVWGRERLEPGLYNASPLLADGQIYSISEDGVTTVIDAGDEFKILSVNRLNDLALPGFEWVAGRQEGANPLSLPILAYQIGPRGQGFAPPHARCALDRSGPI